MNLEELNKKIKELKDCLIKWDGYLKQEIKKIKE